MIQSVGITPNYSRQNAVAFGKNQWKDYNGYVKAAKEAGGNRGAASGLEHAMKGASKNKGCGGLLGIFLAVGAAITAAAPIVHKMIR